MPAWLGQHCVPNSADAHSGAGEIRESRRLGTTRRLGRSCGYRRDARGGSPAARPRPHRPAKEMREIACQKEIASQKEIVVLAALPRRRWACETSASMGANDLCSRRALKPQSIKHRPVPPASRTAGRPTGPAGRNRPGRSQVSPGRS